MNSTQRIVCPSCNKTNRVVIERLADQPFCGQCKQPLLDGNPLELTAGNFDRHIANSDLPILVDFWAPWCGPCRMMAPVIEAAAKTLETSVRVAKLNTEAESEIATRFRIRSIPTLAIFQHGQLVQQRAGATDLADLMQWLKAVITHGS